MSRRPAIVRATVLAACVLAGIAVRAGRLLERPFLHSDGPAYLRIAAEDIRVDRWRAALTGYFPPLFPAAIRVMHTTGLGWEASGRAAAFAAGVATIPLVARLGTRSLSPAAGLAAAALAAVHPRLVHSSTDVLPEGMLALLVVCWALLVTGTRSAAAFALAGALGGVATLVRPEGIVLAPLAVMAALVGSPRGRRLGSGVAAVAGATLTIAPLLLVLHAARGTWALSGKEAAFVGRKYGVPATSLATLVLEYPGAFVTRYAENLVRQIGYTMTTLEPLLVVPLLVGFAATGAAVAVQRARRIVLATMALFVLGFAVNPGQRYAIALVPLSLPWMAHGGLRLAEELPRLGRVGVAVAARARLVGALTLAGLVVHALLPPTSREACYQRTCGWLAEHGAPPASMMADDARLAWVCGARFVLRPHELRGKGDEALASARARGATILVVPAEEVQAGGGPTAAPLFEMCQGKRRMALYAVSGSGG